MVVTNIRYGPLSGTKNLDGDISGTKRGIIDPLVSQPETNLKTNSGEKKIDHEMYLGLLFVSHKWNTIEAVLW